MAAPTPPPQDRSPLLLGAVFAAVLGSFLTTSYLARQASAEINTLADGLVEEVAPGIERLAAIRTTTFMVELALARALAEPESVEAGARLDAALAQLNTELQLYLSRPQGVPPPMWAQLHPALIRFEDRLQNTRALAEQDRATEARQMFLEQVEPTANHLVNVAMRGIEHYAQVGQQSGVSIKAARRRSVAVATGLSALSVLLGLGGALLLTRQWRNQRRLRDEYEAFLQSRSDELEQFAGRVAHDIRNPLSAAGTGAQLLFRRTQEPRVHELATRILRSLDRANAITSALLEFARAGARPDPGARIELQEVLGDLASGVAEEAEAAHITLRFEPAPPVLVACNTGVYLSLVGNLVRNAMKYMGSAERREITVRTRSVGRWVKTEVSDTGPGIAPEQLDSLFTPYFRAPNTAALPGLGLGLATVKKLVEGHDGQVGVASTVGQGTTVWFTLPLAGLAEPPKPPDREQRPKELRH